MPSPDELLEVMIPAAREAGEAALALRAGGLTVEAKGDLSPVTRADRRAEAIIVSALTQAWPQIPIIAEEACAAGIVPATKDGQFFLVDPIDGTREFIAGRDDFTVNIALVVEGFPVVGCVFVPATAEMFEGSPAGAFRQQGSGAREPIFVRRHAGLLVALASRSHRTEATNRFLGTLDLERVDPVGSSLKFCRVAEGAADVYPCFGPTMEWDTAAGQAVLEAAGGQVVTADSRERFAYGKTGRPDAPDFRNPSFIAIGGVSLPA